MTFPVIHKLSARTIKCRACGNDIAVPELRVIERPTQKLSSDQVVEPTFLTSMHACPKCGSLATVIIGYAAGEE